MHTPPVRTHRLAAKAFFFRHRMSALHYTILDSQRLRVEYMRNTENEVFNVTLHMGTWEGTPEVMALPPLPPLITFRVTTPVVALTLNLRASAPSRVQVTAPMAPLRLGVAEV